MKIYLNKFKKKSKIYISFKITKKNKNIKYIKLDLII